MYVPLLKFLIGLNHPPPPPSFLSTSPHPPHPSLPLLPTPLSNSARYSMPCHQSNTSVY